MDFLTSVAVVAVAIAYILLSAIKIVQEYERGVIFRLGRLVGAKGPGLFFIIPLIDRMVKVDLRTITLDIPSQEAITQDNVTVRVNAVGWWPDQEFSWSVEPVPEFRSLLRLEVYPFTYDAAATDWRFCRDYTFRVTYVASGMEVLRADPDRHVYDPGGRVTGRRQPQGAGGSRRGSDHLRRG